MLSKSLTLLGGALAAVGPVRAIWPIPSEISTGHDVLFLSPDIRVTLNGAPLSPITSRTTTNTTTTLIPDAVARTLDAVFKHGLVPWMLHDANSDYEPAPSSGTATITSLALKKTGKDPCRPTFEKMDESYALNLTSAGAATITAKTSVGILRGLETFTQLFYQHSSSDGIYTNLAPVSIADAPAMPYRALLVDVARHWYSVADIKRAVDGSAMNKLNVLHLHITDTQSWPLEVPALPLLAEKHRYAKGLTYSPADLEDIHAYGAARGVQVILEIDMPGHVGIDRAYPGLSNAFNAKPWGTYCAEPPCGSLKLNDTAVYAFLDTLFDDVLPRVAPHAAYFHTGGDEYKASNSLLDPALRTDDTAVLKPLLHAFLRHAHAKVRAHGLTPLVWEEMVGQWEAPLPTNSTIVQTWFGSDSVQKYAKAGYRVIDTSYDAYYLDCGRGSWVDYADSAITANTSFNSWCDPYKSWRVVYNHDPLAGLEGSEAAKRVIGGEAALWSETVDGPTFDQIAWPRAAAGAEVWWSGRRDRSGKMRSIYEARPRLSEMRERMLARGIVGGNLAPGFCTQSKLGECV
ncbi:uncharacterized protein LMH87_007836 [Akanthomyces muscarius]|uniref:Beta-hexosaminidase n=1 Tax=Akanthomyces muscarius TaxID=2231603 RepID=A0A9W8UR72_AKAMU|nr:uncharacterized protein LMH87_007836 [Akanthomyces muscarius]KAJ4159899.1 hypothetical protein LMH87_007836 [Akanthomyces muscarius]